MRNKDPPYEDKTTSRSSYPGYAKPYAGKTASSYRGRPKCVHSCQCFWSYRLRGPCHPTVKHYNDVIMDAMASQITSLTSVYSTVYSGVNKKQNIKAPRHWPLCGEFTGDRWIPRTNDQLRRKCFHLMSSSWRFWTGQYSTWRGLNEFCIAALNQLHACFVCK